MTCYQRFKNLNLNKGVTMNTKKKLLDLRSQIDVAKKQQEKILKEAKTKQQQLLNEVKQLQIQIKIDIADKAILFHKNEISLEELKQFIDENIELI